MSKPMRVVREYVQRGHVEQNIGVTPIAAKKIRVAAYCRVSTKEDDQLNSYEALTLCFCFLMGVTYLF